MSTVDPEKNLYRQYSKKIPLRSILVIPFIVQIFAAVGVTGYFSFRNGQKSVNDLVSKLRQKVSRHMRQHLNSYMATPKKVVRVNSDLIDMNLINIQNTEEQGKLF